MCGLCSSPRTVPSKGLSSAFKARLGSKFFPGSLASFHAVSEATKFTAEWVHLKGVTAISVICEKISYINPRYSKELPNWQHFQYWGWTGLNAQTRYIPLFLEHGMVDMAVEARIRHCPGWWDVDIHICLAVGCHWTSMISMAFYGLVLKNVEELQNIPNSRHRGWCVILDGSSSGSVIFKFWTDSLQIPIKTRWCNRRLPTHHIHSYIHTLQRGPKGPKGSWVESDFALYSIGSLGKKAALTKQSCQTWLLDFPAWQGWNAFLSASMYDKKWPQIVSQTLHSLLLDWYSK